MRNWLAPKHMLAIEKEEKKREKEGKRKKNKGTKRKEKAAGRNWNTERRKQQQQQQQQRAKHVQCSAVSQSQVKLARLSVRQSLSQPAYPVLRDQLVRPFVRIILATTRPYMGSQKTAAR